MHSSVYIKTSALTEKRSQLQRIKDDPVTYAVVGQGKVTEFGFHFALSQFFTLRVKVKERETEIYSRLHNSRSSCEPGEPE